jgi:DNA polymerase-3 subunit epsilon
MNLAFVLLAEEENLSVAQYNQRVEKAVEYLRNALPSFAVVEKISLPKKDAKKGIILIENGRFYGMGYVAADVTMKGVEELKPHLTAYPENGYIRGLVYSYASKYPESKVAF